MAMERRNKWLLGVSGLLVVGAALATHYGVWSCGSCSLDGATPDPDTTAFISTEVNQAVGQWQSGDTVTICNGTTCATYKVVSVVAGISGMQQIAKFPMTGTGGGGSGGPGYYYGGGGVGSPG